MSFLLLRLKICIFALCSTARVRKILKHYPRFVQDKAAAPSVKFPSAFPLSQGQTGARTGIGTGVL